MVTRFPSRRTRRFFLCGAISALICLLATAQVSADTSGSFHRSTTGTCYCHCPVSRAHSGCAKMCEPAKYASRWWATSCVKPHRQTSGANSKAGPRLPHPDRAEHAQLDPTPSASQSR